MKEGLILIDDGGVVLTSNKSARDIIGGNVENRNILHVCRDTGFQGSVRRCLAGGNAEIRMERGGRVFSVYFSPVSSGGEITGGAILFFDRTDRHRAEKQRKEFSANVSHELKTPLTSISALAEMIAGGIAKDGDIKGFAEKITTHTQRLISIIEDTIRLSEFDEGIVERSYSEVDLYELAGSVIEALSDKAAEKDIAVTVSGARLRLSANKRMVDELLYNLIDNAVKYNKPGGDVSVTLAVEGGFCEITVADTGVGIPEDHQGRVFERFFRVDGSRCKKTGGAGLGLSIVKHIAEHHGGSVELTSKPGKGTTVKCRLPGHIC
jgi:two-component system phosphate regulon sensor histidine kinase PhoR